MFFGVSLSAEEALSSYFDTKERQYATEQIDAIGDDMNDIYRVSNIYPTECGIFEHPPGSGQKILTLFKNDEFVHLSLANVCKQIWTNVPGTDWNSFSHCFVGSEATQFLLDAELAPSD